MTVLAASQVQESSTDGCAGFSYDAAFSRNIGWVTREEQQKLRAKRVAIAGMGGVGGIHAVTLARLGLVRSASLTLIISTLSTSTARLAPPLVRCRNPRCQ